MADKKKEFIKMNVGPGVAAYVHLDKPDTGEKYSDDKYKVTLVVDKDAPFVAEFTKLCEKAAKAEWPKVPFSKISSPLKDGDEKSNEDMHGKYLLTAKTKNAPRLVDAKRQPLPKGIIKHGDLVKVSMTLNACAPSGNKTVALWLNGVQLLEKRNTGYDAASDFDEEDGYAYDEAEHDADDESGASDDNSDSGEDDADF